MKRLLTSVTFIFLSLISAGSVADGCSIFGDLLVWHASQQTGSSWASIVSIPSNKTFDVNATNINFNWNPAFRGGIIYEAPRNVWDAKLYWTYFRAKTKNSISITEQLVLPEFFSGFLSGNYFFGANLDWKIAMNMIDYNVGHIFEAGKSFTVRPSIGIKGGTINQTLNAAWNAALYIANERVKNNFSGVGPSFGVDTRWKVFDNLSISADFATAFMWGNWRVVDTYTRPYVASVVTPTTIVTSLKSNKLGTMMFNYCLGLEYTYRGRSELTFLLGYEMQVWPSQLRIPTFQQLPLHSDLTLQGATCRIRIDL